MRSLLAGLRTFQHCVCVIAGGCKKLRRLRHLAVTSIAEPSRELRAWNAVPSHAPRNEQIVASLVRSCGFSLAAVGRWRWKRRCSASSTVVEWCERRVISSRRLISIHDIRSQTGRVCGLSCWAFDRSFENFPRMSGQQLSGYP